jgi:RNA polymerase subunit RPABC4/transcription elongation factor Spt4
MMGSRLGDITTLMISCPNCHHQNPEGADRCEACYTALPCGSGCPNCGFLVQVGTNFCGQCGSKLSHIDNLIVNPTMIGEPDSATEHFPSAPILGRNSPGTITRPIVGEAPISGPLNDLESDLVAVAPKTQLQVYSAQVLHIQSNTVIELPLNLSVIRIGKPYDRGIPDIDVSGFSHSNVVSRAHANIRQEGDTYYIEDVGSSNGTYINNVPLPVGNRHRLKSGDRISLGKGDLMTFLFLFAQS